jgi:predicted RNA-binding protein with PUA-like domain
MVRLPSYEVLTFIDQTFCPESAFDPAHPYYDPKSVRENPKWSVVHVEFRAKFDNLITLADIKSLASPGKPLDGLQMTRQTRLSVSAVTRKQWKYLMSLAELSDADKSALGG